ncbi:MAG: Rossmann-like and DUF2520 domain-containing protein [Streptosporangiaceae bacterium]
MRHEGGAGAGARDGTTHDTTDRPGRLAVGVVGAGRAGAILGAALARAGHTVVAASGDSDRSRRLAGEHLPDVPLVEPREVAARSRLVLLTVPDDVLPEVAADLADHLAAGTLVVHAAGRYGIDVLEPATRRGGLPLALHPVMTFTGRPDDLARLAGCFFGVTAPDPLRPIAEALVVEMGGEPMWVPEGRRGLYHAALANAANHLVTLVADSVELLREAGVADPARMVGPLLGASLDNSLRFGMGALTGPVARGDAATVARHVEELRRVSTEATAAYVAMARLTADRALQVGLLAPEDAERLLDVLAGPGARA